ncbi:SRPBCC family protein [Bacillus shivajii]|uniref:SRPBCC family protein n=1 Tax=Bacillus shivajii TaxID=1983719 RepID=UPI001CFB4D8E|nr:SRPBCC family protein [Bacillus shivajii]UCZ51623.1 SRPBCC family protein [Bacillus shivajii]
MADFHEEVTIVESIDDVFQFIANPKNATYYFVNVVEVDQLTDGEIKVGAKFKEFRQLANRKVGAELEVTKYEPVGSYAIKSNANGLEVIYHYTFEETENGTKVVFTGNVKTKKLSMKLMRPLLVKMMKREDGDHLKGVKKLLEDTHQE